MNISFHSPKVRSLHIIKIQTFLEHPQKPDQKFLVQNTLTRCEGVILTNMLFQWIRRIDEQLNFVIDRYELLTTKIVCDYLENHSIVLS